MISLAKLVKESNSILITRRSKEEREPKYIFAIDRQIKAYIKDGSVGDLILTGSPIKSLPDNLVVDGDLRLDDTQIKSLPNNLQVYGDLDLAGTPITSLPRDLVVGGSLDITRTPISKKYTQQQLKAMLPHVDGYIYLKFSDV